uniref:Uncharacterized protein n=1 Tax=Homalodisca liturata TaxID=320908 RepID=A0A1B6J7H2_9HEMI
MSSNDKPTHQLCPIDNETWCKYNLSLLTNEMYDHDKHFHIPECVMSFIKPVFKDLSETKLLERFLKGNTQNQNESLNNVIWSLIPKRTFVTLPTLKFGVYSSVCSCNDGFYSKLQVLEALNLRPGKNFVKAMQRLDIVRVKEADKKVQELEKKIRNKIALKRKRLEDMFTQSEDPDNPS